MKITRDGKTYELTANELWLAYDEMLHNNWRDGIREAIDRNSENLRFIDYTVDEFIEECVDRIEQGCYDGDEEQWYDDILFNEAEADDIWYDGEECEDE